MEETKNIQPTEQEQTADTATAQDGERKTRRGGYRKGAGRKYTTGKGISVGVRLPRDVYAFLALQPSKSAFVAQLIRDYCKENNIQLS